MSGRGIPVTGRIPIFIPAFTVNPMIKTKKTPDASSCPNGSRVARAMPIMRDKSIVYKATTSAMPTVLLSDAGGADGGGVGVAVGGSGVAVAVGGRGVCVTVAVGSCV